ncbi:MAG: putative transcriptional regulator [Alphaproteobacteria bacterium]|jgi:predicted transcriptional regulator
MNLDHIVDSSEVLETTTDLIVAYIGRNKVSVDEMCNTIGNVYKTVYTLGRSNRALSYKELLNGGTGPTQG